MPICRQWSAEPSPWSACLCLYRKTWENPSVLLSRELLAELCESKKWGKIEPNGVHRAAGPLFSHISGLAWSQAVCSKAECETLSTCVSWPWLSTSKPWKTFTSLLCGICQVRENLDAPKTHPGHQFNWILSRLREETTLLRAVTAAVGISRSPSSPQDSPSPKSHGAWQQKKKNLYLWQMDVVVQQVATRR